MNRKTFLFSLPALGAAIKLAAETKVAHQPFNLIDEMHLHPIKKAKSFTQPSLRFPTRLGIDDILYFDLESAAEICKDSIPCRAYVPYHFRSVNGNIINDWCHVKNVDQASITEFRDQIERVLNRHDELQDIIREYLIRST